MRVYVTNTKALKCTYNYALALKNRLDTLSTPDRAEIDVINGRNINQPPTGHVSVEAELK